MKWWTRGRRRFEGQPSGFEFELDPGVRRSLQRRAIWRALNKWPGTYLALAWSPAATLLVVWHQTSIFHEISVVGSRVFLITTGLETVMTWATLLVIFGHMLFLGFWYEPEYGRMAREVWRERCLACGYLLRGLSEGPVRCPECGVERPADPECHG